MKRLLFVTLEYPPDVGGVAAYYYQFVRHLPANDCAVLNRYTHKLLPWPKSFSTIKQALNTYRPQVILVGQVLPLGTVVLLLSVLYHVPYIVFIHGMDITVPQQFLRKRILLKLILKRASHIIAVSNYTAEKIKAFDSSLRTPINVLQPSGHITPALIDLHGTPPDIPKRYMLSVGRLIERKGFDHAITAFAQIHKQFPDVHYIIAGSGKYEAHLRQVIDQHQLQSVIQIRGGLSDIAIAQLYRHCEFVVMPARIVARNDFEGFGITVLEANSFAKPVIGGIDSGMADAISHQKTGWLVNGNDITEIAKTMQLALSDPTSTERLGKQAQVYYQRPEFSWENKVKMFEQSILNSLT